MVGRIGFLNKLKRVNSISNLAIQRSALLVYRRRRRVTWDKLRQYPFHCCLLLDFVLQLIAASIRQDIDDRVVASPITDDLRSLRPSNTVKEFCEWIEKSEEWEGHRKSMFRQIEKEAIAKITGILDNKNVSISQ